MTPTASRIAGAWDGLSQTRKREVWGGLGLYPQTA